MALKWDPLSNGSYLSATLNVVRVAARMTQVLADLHAAGLSFGKVHLVGHSLGAQMSGLIGSSVQSNSKNKLIIDRISALDPAGPLFYTLLGAIPILVRKVTSSDAVFVDVIHTDAGYLGEPNSCGHVDFWPCSGTRYAPCCSVVASLLTVDDRRLILTNENGYYNRIILIFRDMQSQSLLATVGRQYNTARRPDGILVH